MQITRTTSKYYVLSVLGALMVAVGVLGLAPSAQAQDPPPDPPDPPKIDKECTPNPVQLGEQITCTIDLVLAPMSGASANPFFGGAGVKDTFPAGIRPTGVTVPRFVECNLSEDTVSCRAFFIVNMTNMQQTTTISIDATAEECGSFTNTVTASGFFGRREGSRFIPDGGFFDIKDMEEITVEGCDEEPPAPVPGQQQPNQQPNQQQGVPAPITQEGEQESESGDIDQTFEITSEGDNSSQCAGVQGVSNTGNSQNVIDLLQAASEVDDFEFEEVGSDITVSPESSTTCDQQVNQAASASG